MTMNKRTNWSLGDYKDPDRWKSETVTSYFRPGVMYVAKPKSKPGPTNTPNLDLPNFFGTDPVDYTSETRRCFRASPRQPKPRRPIIPLKNNDYFSMNYNVKPISTTQEMLGDPRLVPVKIQPEYKPPAIRRKLPCFKSSSDR